MILDFIANLFAVPFGYIISFLYGLTGSYICSLILITVFVKLCLLPIGIYKTKRNKEQAETRAKIKAIKEKYPEDKAKAQQEINQLQENTKKNIKGLGFFTFFLQLAVLVGLLNVLNTPLTNILRINDSTIEKMETVMSEAIETSGETNRTQIVLLEEVENYKETLLDDGVLTDEMLTKILTLQEKFTLFNVNLSLKPSLKEINELWLFPIAFTVLMLTSGVYSFWEARKRRKLTGPLAVLDYIPLIITALYFFMFFMFPVGITFYFTISNLITFVQRIVLTKIYMQSNKPSKEPVIPQAI